MTHRRCLPLVRLEVMREPFTKEFVAKFFKKAKNVGDFEPRTFMEKKLIPAVSKFIANELTTPVAQRLTPDSPDDPTEAAAAPNCWLEHTEVELCENEEGELVWCRCDYYECDNKPGYKICTPEQPT